LIKTINKLFISFIKVPKFGNIFFFKILFRNRKFLFSSIKEIKLFKKKIFFELNLDDWIQCQIYFLNKYEDYEINVVSEVLKEGDIFVDVGANFGLYSLWSSKIVGDNGKVFSFEPFETNLSSLKRNIELNSLSNIIVIDKAVTNKNSDIQLFFNERDQNLGMVSSFNFDNGISTNVKTISLDNFFSENKISSLKFIKIDIEGGEYLALLGMIETLKKYRPIVQIEIDDSILDFTPYNKDDIFCYFKNIKYEVFNPELKQNKNLKKSIHSKNYYFKSSVN
jgi:FkbM family methyltransferase